MTTKTYSKKKTYSYKEKEYKIADLAKLTGRSASNIGTLIRHGWSIADVVEIPIVPPVLYEYEGKMLSVKELSKLCNIPDITLANRLRIGWSVERAMSETPKKRISKQYLYKGKKYNIAELSKISGFSFDTVKRRLDDGWSVKKAVEKPIVTGATYSYKGKMLTVNQLAKLSGLKGVAHETLVQLIINRLRHGWSAEEAVDTPKNQVRSSRIKKKT